MMMDGIRSRLDTIWGGDFFGAYGMIWASEDLTSMRNRSRRLEENNPLACGILDRAVENVIGTGIDMRAATADPDFNAALNEDWKRKTSETQFDVRGVYSFAEMQRLTFRAKKRDGDVGVAMIDEGFGLQLQIIEGQDVESPYNLFAPNIINGVEFSPVGRPIAYWIRQIDAWGSVTHKRVEARDIIWLHEHFRYNTIRGIPSFHGCYTLFDQIIGYLDAVVVAARIGASQAMIIETENTAGAIAAAQKAADRAAGRGVAVEDSVGTPRGAVPISPGMVNYVKSGTGKMSAFNPSQPQAQMPDAIRTFGRFLGLKFGLTIERVLLDFSGANYSVSRSTSLQEQKTAEVDQDVIYRRMLARIWRVNASKFAQTYTGQAPKDIWRHEWMPQGRPLVEPSKDAPGMIALIQANLESFKNYCAARGENWEQIGRDNAEACDLYRELGITPPAMLAAAAKAGSGDKDPSDEEKEGDEVDPLEAANAYGVYVRAGVITPQIEDEENFRKLMGYPPMSGAAKAAWQADKGTRRPITITPAGGAAAVTTSPFSTTPITGEDDDAGN